MVGGGVVVSGSLLARLGKESIESVTFAELHNQADRDYRMAVQRLEQERSFRPRASRVRSVSAVDVRSTEEQRRSVGGGGWAWGGCRFFRG